MRLPILVKEIEMKFFSKITASLLLVAMLVSAVACGSVKNDPADTTTAANTTTVADGTTAATEPAETQDPTTVPEIAEVTYEGETFLVANDIIGDTKYSSDSMFNFEVTGDIYEDAVYQRTVLIEELFKIKLEEIKVGSTDVINTVMAGTDEYDLHTATLSNMNAVVNRKCVYDLYEIEELHLNKAWWDQNAQQKCSFDGKLYYTFSDFVITGVDNSRATYFNKTLHHELGLENLYQLVDEGKWTYTKMAEMAKVAVSDLNGDGQITTADRMGIYNGNTTFYEAMLTGCDAELVKMGEDGIPYFFWMDEQERFIEVYQALLSTFMADNIYVKGGGELDNFKQDRTLFTIAVLSYAVKWRAETIEFGILPVPKWDEAQETYLNVSPNGHALMIPVTVADTDRVGNILEALSYYSSKYYSEDAAMPAYFEKALTAKSARDDESAKSLEIIHDNICYTVKIVANSLSFYTQLDNFNMNISSVIKANEKVQKKLLDKAIAELGAG